MSTKVIQTLTEENERFFNALLEIAKRRNLSAASAIIMRNTARDTLKAAGILLESKK